MENRNPVNVSSDHDEWDSILSEDIFCTSKYLLARSGCSLNLDALTSSRQHLILFEKKGIRFQILPEESNSNTSVKNIFYSSRNLRYHTRCSRLVDALICYRQHPRAIRKPSPKIVKEILLDIIEGHAEWDRRINMARLREYFIDLPGTSFSQAESYMVRDLMVYLGKRQSEKYRSDPPEIAKMGEDYETFIRIVFLTLASFAGLHDNLNLHLIILNYRNFQYFCDYFSKTWNVELRKELVERDKKDLELVKEWMTIYWPLMRRAFREIWFLLFMDDRITGITL